MKNIFSFIFCLLGVSMLSQTSSHPTIDKVQAMYKSVPSASLSVPNGHPDIRVRSQVTITLKAGADAARVYIKMLNAQGQVLYQVNYLTSSPALTGAEGFKLFYQEGNTIHINDPDVLSLQPFKYDVYTEDSQGTATQVFSVTQ